MTNYIVMERREIRIMTNNKEIKILSICGSGIVTSSMVAGMLVDMFTEEGYKVKTVEAMPGNMGGICEREHFDLIAYSSPISDNYGVPALSAMGLLTGTGEEEFKEAALKILHDAGK